MKEGRRMSEERVAEILKRLQIKSRDELKELHLKIFNSVPFFDVELATHCNNNCGICPRDKISRPKGIMEPQVFENLSKWYPSNSNVMFCGMGEPLLNPNLIEYIKINKKRELITNITTNGILLTKSKIDELVESGIDLIQISVNATSQKILDKISPKVNFEKLHHNLQYLSSVKPDNLDVQLTYIKQSQNFEEYDKVQTLANKLNFSFFSRIMHSRGGFLYNPESFSDIQGCGLFIKSTFITWEGDILACCQDLTGTTKLGNIRNLTYSELINKKEQFINEDEWFPMCKNCDDLFSRYLFLDNPHYLD